MIQPYSFVTVKTRRIDAEREKVKCISTRNSSNYATMHQEKVWKKTPAKIGHFGQNDEYLTNFVCTNNSRKSRARINEWDEAFAEVYSKIPQTITAYKLELNDLPDPYFCPYSRQIAEFVKKKRSPVANPEDSRIPSSYFWCENHIQVNWNKNFTFLRTRGKIVKFEKKSVITCALR